MAQDVMISISNLKPEIKRHLSIIGKRLYTKDGKNMFSDITLSSAESDNILEQYIETSIQNVEANLKQFISETSISSDITIKIENTRGDDDFVYRVNDMVSRYVILNTVGEYLSMVHPDIAQKYQADARQRMEALITYVYYKKPPIEQSDTLSFTDPTGSVTTESNEETTENQEGETT